MSNSRGARLCLLLLLLLPNSGLLARDQNSPPTPYGLRYHLASDTDSADLPVLLRSAPEAARYRQQVEDAELADGPYSPMLAETLTDEASYLEQHGNHEAAIVSLRRAVHVTRINDGLHSGMQLPMVRRLIRSAVRPKKESPAT